MHRNVTDGFADDFGHPLGVIDHVRLVQHHDRRSAALDGDQQISFDSSGVEIPVETGDEENGIDVCGDDLLLGCIAGRATGELATSRQHGNDSAVTRMLRWLNRHPVADGRKIHPCGRAVPKAAGYTRERFARVGDHAINVRVLKRDATRNQPLGR
jgi:hypothetical protein